MGRGFSPLAIVGFDALERWDQKVERAVLQPHLSALLPSIEPYLTPIQQQLEGTAGAHTKTKAVAKRAENAADTASQVEAQRLNSLSARAVQFLGQLGGENLTGLLDTSTSGSDRPSWIAWSSKKFLSYTLPALPESSVDISFFLDDTLPVLVK